MDKSAEEIKELGNEAYRCGKFEKALDLFTKSIDIDANNAIYFVNRSLCYASLKLWKQSENDAKSALKLSPTSHKAHFRLVKALIELQQFRDARSSLSIAFKECGELKELKTLEDDLTNRTGIPLRPKSTDFEIIGELGEGNFSKVFKACHKQTKAVFAIKTIEKMTVDKMKKRHGNINNEILMEKRALNRLDHAGIVTLYSTFQDYGTLYFMMEYIGGHDLWELLHDIQLTGHLNSISGKNGGNYSNGTLNNNNIGGSDIIDIHNNIGAVNSSGADDAVRAQVGCHWSLAQFYFAEAIDAVEYMHSKGIAHRDIKPENMIIGIDGHLKFVDFGTAKDFIHTDLNGPEFVGTSEYLSPSTVRSSKNKKCGIEVDLWALGIVLFQMILGYTPFAAASPYLTFLRIKRAHLRLPEWVPAPISSMIRLLLQSSARKRLISATSHNIDRECSDDISSDISLSNAAQRSVINYDALRRHCMFASWNAAAATTTVASTTASENNVNNDCQQREDTSSNSSNNNGISTRYTLNNMHNIYQQSAVRVPLLHELCIRAVGKATLVLADAIAANGGIRPKQPIWMKHFQLHRLPFLDHARIQHYLCRQQRLHGPGVYRLFCNSAIDARSLRADPCLSSSSISMTASSCSNNRNNESSDVDGVAAVVSSIGEREYLGMNRSLQGHWDKDFVFMQIASPSFGYSTNTSSSSSTDDKNISVATDEMELRQLLSAVNKIRPKLLVVMGNFTNTSYPDVVTVAHTINNSSTAESKSLFDEQVEKFRKCMARLSDTIPAIYVPGCNDVGHLPTPSSLLRYRHRFGADYYGFWYGGMRGLVINSTLMIYPNCAPAEQAQQELWLSEEIEQAKLCSTSITIFSYHPWFHTHIDEEDDDNTCSNIISNNRSNIIRAFPKALRLKWLKKLRHHKVRITFSSSSSAAAAPPTTDKRISLRPYPHTRSSNNNSSSSNNNTTSNTDDNSEQDAVTTKMNISDENLKPSEIIAQAVASGEIVLEAQEEEKHAETVDVVDTSLLMPPVPPTSIEETAVLQPLSTASTATTAASSSESSDSDDDEDNQPHPGDNEQQQTQDKNNTTTTANNKINDCSDDEEDDEEEEEEGFTNEEEDYEGPELLFSTALFHSYHNITTCKNGEENSVSATDISSSSSDAAVVRAVLVQENNTKCRCFTIKDMPSTLNSMLELLQ